MISVIIVSCNSGTLLLECVQSVLESTCALEVIVSDNDSVDCSIEALQELASREPRLCVIRNGANLGFGRGNNVALSRARGEHVLFLNPDCILGEDTLSRMAAALERHPDAGMAGCLIRNPDGSEQAGCRRRMPTPFAVEAISGAIMLVRTAALKQVGAFDEACFMHGENLDLCPRFRRAGWEILFVPDVEVVRFKGRSSRRTDDAGFAGLRTFVGECREEVWVFGASSLVGRYLLPRLVAAGYCVRAFGRDPAAGKAVDSTKLFWHRFDFDGATPLPADGRPAVAIHLAPLRLLPGQLDPLAARGMKRLIGFGSTSRFTKRGSENAKERRLVADLEAAEQEIESRCGRLGVRWAVFRPTLIYSLGHDRNVSVLAGFIRRFRFFPMPGEGSGLRQPIHADDLAAACVALLNTGEGWNQAYNLSGSQVLSYRAMVEAIFAKLGLRARIVPFSRNWWRALLWLARLMPAYRDINIEMIGRVNADMCFGHEAAARNFGFAPRKFDL